MPRHLTGTDGPIAMSAEILPGRALRKARRHTPSRLRRLYNEVFCLTLCFTLVSPLFQEFDDETRLFHTSRSGAALAAVRRAGVCPNHGFRRCLSCLSDTWTSSTTAYVGYTTANGSVTVAGGSGLLSGTSYLGYTSGLTGTVTVDGSGSNWQPEILLTGYQGAGVINITNGGSVAIHDPTNAYWGHVGSPVVPNSNNQFVGQRDGHNQHHQWHLHQQYQYRRRACSATTTPRRATQMARSISTVAASSS